MVRNFILSALPVVGAAALCLGVSACSSDKGGGGGGKDGGTGGSTSSSGGSTSSSGGSTSSSGGSTSSSGGSTAKGGSSGMGGADQYVCDKAPPRDPGGTAKEGDSCCKTSAGFSAGKCVKTSSISDPLRKAAYGHDTCTASSDASDLKCAPTDSAIADAGSLGVFETCKATFGGSLALEGRCLPKCFVAGMGAAANLAQETCMTKDFVCAPCYNPIDGKDTGACSQKMGDAPKDPAPAPFKKCGAIKSGDADLGLCVPETLVTDPVQKAALKTAFTGDAGVADVCASGQVCAPTLKVNDLNACFKHCTSIAGPGACVPTFLVPAMQRSLLSGMPDVCDKATEMCAPCLNPLSMPANQPTGACN